MNPIQGNHQHFGHRRSGNNRRENNNVNGQIQADRASKRSIQTNTAEQINKPSNGLAADSTPTSNSVQQVLNQVVQLLQMLLQSTGLSNISTTQAVNGTNTIQSASAVSNKTSTASTSSSTGLNHAAGVSHTVHGTADKANEFSKLLGKSVMAVDFLDQNQSADEAIVNPSWLLDPYSKWKAEDPERKLVLSVPLIQKGETLAGKANDSSYTERFKQLAQNMVDKGLGDSVIRLGWEANGDWMPWSAGSDPTAFKQNYRDAVEAMKSIPGANFKFDFNVNVGHQSIADIYPGDDVVDIIGIDAYDQLNGSGNFEQLYNQSNGLKDIQNFANAHGKQLSVPEWGITDVSGDDADYINKMANFMKNANLAYQSYFNDPGGNVNTTLEQNPKAYKAYIENFGQ